MLASSDPKSLIEFALKDLADQAFQPFIRCDGERAVCPLISQAILYWLEQDPKKYSALGPMMYPFWGMRPLFQAAGLNMPQGPLIQEYSLSPAWDRIQQQITRQHLSTAEALYWMKFSYIANFPENANTFLDHIEDDTPEIQAWLNYYKQLRLHLSQKAYPLPNPALSSAPLDSLASDVLQPTIESLLLTSSTHLIQGDKKSSAMALNNLITAIGHYADQQPFPSPEVALYRARAARFKAMYFLNSGDSAQALSCFEQGLAELAESRQQLPPELRDSSRIRFLFDETARRILEKYALILQECGETAQAQARFTEMVALDPHCARALMLAGDFAQQQGLLQEACTLYARASQCGVMERAYCLKQLAALATVPGQKSLQFRLALEQDALQNQDFLNQFLQWSDTVAATEPTLNASGYGAVAQQRYGPQAVDTPWPPVAFDFVSEQTKILTPPPIESLMNYQRYRPYWELRSGEVAMPIMCHTPLLALDVLNHAPDLRFTTHYTQRAMVEDFRRELHYGTTCHLRDGVDGQLTQVRTSLDYLRGTSSQADDFFDMYDRRQALSLPQYTSVLRVIGALGFVKEVIHCIESDSLPSSSISFEADYFNSYKLHSYSVYHLWEGLSINDLLQNTYAAYCLDEESLRIRLTTCYSGMVHNGQQQNLEQLKYWRQEGFRVLESIEKSHAFSLFEKSLLTSRFYRAATYYPFLTQDHETLLYEMGECERLAREIVPSNDRESLIRVENLFPMIESMGRCWSALGEKEKALSYLREIVTDIDPYDSKAWVQYGDMLYKQEDYPAAREAFLKAGYLGGPLSRVAMYRAGTSCERLGDLEDAKFCYEYSLQLWPSGVKPLIRLYALAKMTSDSYLLYWATDMLNRLLQEVPDLDGTLAKRIRDVLQV